MGLWIGLIWLGPMISSVLLLSPLAEEMLILSEFSPYGWLGLVMLTIRDRASYI
jgi:hypothetical protein